MRLIDWSRASDDLWEHGFAKLGRVMSVSECRTLRAMYEDDSRFRSRIEMLRYRFGKGEYKYFRYPFPDIVQELRTTFYAGLAPVARRWMEALSLPLEYPTELEQFLQICHDANQWRPTPLLLRYREGDYNRLHQDIYGAVVFPFQVITCLSKEGEEFTGGELLLVEQQPRAQSIGNAIRMEQGESVVVTTRYRPAKGAKGYYRSNLKHGVSKMLSGERYTLGIIFHDGE